MHTQSEIARRLKLSQATVSRALSDDRSLPLVTKLKVKQLALELGYEPRRYANRNRLDEESEKSDRLLALVHHVPTQDGKYYSLLLEMIQGFIQAAAAERLTLIVKEVENMEAARKIIAEYCNDVAGAVLILRYPEEMIDLFCSALHCVSLNHRYENLKIQTVEPQQETSFIRLYRYLYENGHHRIGFLTVRNSYQFALSRYAGYQQAAYLLNNSYAPEWIMNIRPGEQLEMPEIADRIIRLRRQEQVDAYLCTSGHFAKNLIAELDRRGLQVPEDISLAAFDDILTPAASGHLLCGMQANYERMAATAIRMLQNPAAFAGATVICCEAEFHRGNTVSLLEFETGRENSA